MDCVERRIAVEAKSLLFPTRDGTPITFSVVTKEGKVWRNDALADSLVAILKSLAMKRDRLAWYSLRQTAATWATDCADEDSTVGEGNQFLLGQASDVMWNTYSKGVPPSVRKAVKAIWLGLNDGGTVEVE